MTAVALPVTGGLAAADHPVRSATPERHEPAFALYVDVPDTGVAGRALMADIAEAVTELVARLAPEATVHTALDLGGRGRRDVVARLRESVADPYAAPPSASERALAAWRLPTPTAERIVLDSDARELTVGGRPVPLTFTEFALLEYLLRSPHRAVPRGELLATVWRGGPGVGTRTIDVHVRRLREKLGGCLQIVTVRGVGYRCDPAPEIVLVGSGDAG
ncbi:winged helix-turn-helix transcriptional regulator [Actinotalea ferrariae]|uniref:winged helix-turn-helix domain-containing protein n=1 Tax=Actinotalea ferrariae TaxID=1386098 RepID=UPI001C8CCE46|nr:winged helix-turn-helix domain-containing protein [Actinotalea ferrariae]MBX9244564.1 winged helix-turn-helix transcriptional regulator [Actinotalea ferrariae]